MAVIGLVVLMEVAGFGVVGFGGAAVSAGGQ